MQPDNLNPTAAVHPTAPALAISSPAGQKGGEPCDERESPMISCAHKHVRLATPLSRTFGRRIVSADEALWIGRVYNDVEKSTDSRYAAHSGKPHK